LGPEGKECSGSVNGICDTTTGKCSCNAGYIGYDDCNPLGNLCANPNWLIYTDSGSVTTPLTFTSKNKTAPCTVTGSLSFPTS